MVKTQIQLKEQKYYSCNCRCFYPGICCSYSQVWLKVGPNAVSIHNARNLPGELNFFRLSLKTPESINHPPKAHKVHAISIAAMSLSVSSRRVLRGGKKRIAEPSLSARPK